jgi:hypothetical protein
LLFCNALIHWLPTDLYAMHFTFAMPKNATLLYPLVLALATPIWTLRYIYMRCSRRGPLVVLPAPHDAVPHDAAPLVSTERSTKRESFRPSSLWGFQTRAWAKLRKN